jgi:hypothetical protein
MKKLTKKEIAYRNKEFAVVEEALRTYGAEDFDSGVPWFKSYLLKTRCGYLRVSLDYSHDDGTRQAPDVKTTAKQMLEALKTIEQYLYWAIDPEEKDGGRYFSWTLIEHAHALVDLGHAYRAALAAAPPPADDEDDAA